MKKVAKIFCLLCISECVSAEIVTYEFSGTVTSKTGVFSAESAETVSGTFSFSTEKYDIDFPFCAGYSPYFSESNGYVDLERAVVLRHGDNTYELSTSVAPDFAISLIFFADYDLDRVQMAVDSSQEYERSTFFLDTGEVVDGIGPGGAHPGCVEGDGDSPFDFYGGVLTGSLDQDINVFSRANFLDPWAGLATGALRQWVGNTIASELAFRWTSFGPVVPDTDGDGIKDPVDGQWQGGVFIDESTSFSNYFADQGVVGAPGTTFGEILTRGGLTIQVVDDKSAGLNLTASGASGTADVRVCGFATLQLSSGDSLAIECGSITTTVLAGTANMQFGSQTTLTAPEGASFRVEALSPDAFSVTNTSEEGSDIEIFVNDGFGDIGVLPNITVETGVRGVDVMVMQGRASQKCVNLNQRGLLQAAVLGETDLDPTSVDVSALTLSGLLPGGTGSGESSCRVMDVNDDGLWDLICKFEKNAATWDGDETRMTLKGKLIDNTRIEGVDPVCVSAKGLLR